MSVTIVARNPMTARGERNVCGAVLTAVRDELVHLVEPVAAGTGLEWSPTTGQAMIAGVALAASPRAELEARRQALGRSALFLPRDEAAARLAAAIRRRADRPAFVRSLRKALELGPMSAPLLDHADVRVELDDALSAPPSSGAAA